MMRIRFGLWSLVTTFAAAAACVSAEQLDEDGHEFDELAEGVTIDTAGLSPDATELANRLATRIDALSHAEIARLLALLKSKH